MLPAYTCLYCHCKVDTLIFSSVRDCHVTQSSELLDFIYISVTQAQMNKITELFIYITPDLMEAQLILILLHVLVTRNYNER